MNFLGLKACPAQMCLGMRAFCKEYKKVPPVVGQIEELGNLGVLMQIPWSHNIILMETIENIEQRLWYAEKTVEISGEKEV